MSATTLAVVQNATIIGYREDRNDDPASHVATRLQVSRLNAFQRVTRSATESRAIVTIGTHCGSISDVEFGGDLVPMSVELLHSILESAVSGIITIDSHGVVQTFTPAAERMFGYESVDVIGRNVSLLMPEPDHRLALSLALVRVMGGRLEVESALGVGSSFTVLLLLIEAAEPQATERSPMTNDFGPATADVAQGLHGPLTVVYIGDSKEAPWPKFVVCAKRCESKVPELAGSR